MNHCFIYNNIKVKNPIKLHLRFFFPAMHHRQTVSMHVCHSPLAFKKQPSTEQHNHLSTRSVLKEFRTQRLLSQSQKQEPQNCCCEIAANLDAYFFSAQTRQITIFQSQSAISEVNYRCHQLYNLVNDLLKSNLQRN